MALRMQDISLRTTSFSNRTSSSKWKKTLQTHLGGIEMFLMAEDISTALFLPGILIAVLTSTNTRTQGFAGRMSKHSHIHVYDDSYTASCSYSDWWLPLILGGPGRSTGASLSSLAPNPCKAPIQQVSYHIPHH